MIDEEFSNLTLSNSPFGRFRFLRMPFGLRTRQDILQLKTDETAMITVGSSAMQMTLLSMGRMTKNITYYTWNQESRHLAQ